MIVENGLILETPERPETRTIRTYEKSEIEREFQDLSESTDPVCLTLKKEGGLYTMRITWVGIWVRKD